MKLKNKMNIARHSAFTKFCKALSIISILFLSLFLALSAGAKESILSFYSDIELLDDGSVNVSEMIKVQAQGIKIKRGIYRDIPTIMKNADGSDFRSKIKILSIKKNGVNESYFTKKIKNGIRIYIGESSVFLGHGIYEYEIRYNMTRQVRFFENHDELFWNVTGNFWDFPIKQSSARITLPQGAIISDIVGYSGEFGSSKQNVTIKKLSNNSALIKTIGELNPYEGMSVAIKFNKNIVREPEGIEQTALYVSDRRNIFIPIIGVALVLIYYFFSWLKVGRDPKKGVIVPLFYPPEGFSPALVHFIWYDGWRKGGWTAFSAALINLAVKGLINIKKTKNSTRIDVTSSPRQKLPIGEQIIYDFIQSKESLFLNKDNGAKLNSTRDQFTKQIGTENRHLYFKNNKARIIIGYFISLIILIAMVAFGAIDMIYAIISIAIGVILGLVATIYNVLSAKSSFARIFIIVWIIIAFFNSFSAIFAAMSDNFDYVAIFAIASIVILNIVFTILMRAPTILGRKVKDEIEGFRLYLETAEKQRLNMDLNMENEPELSAKRFEEILPFAIALGVEKPWANYFENELARNVIKDVKTGYNPSWYSATNFSPSNIGKNMAAIGSGLSASMIATQVSSSSSSGFSSSGGFSGGGGGGGGGGGW